MLVATVSLQFMFIEHNIYINTAALLFLISFRSLRKRKHSSFSVNISMSHTPQRPLVSHLPCCMTCSYNPINMYGYIHSWISQRSFVNYFKLPILMAQ